MKADVVIVGAGLSGLYTALHLKDNLNVILICKKELKLNNSYLAQGGIATELQQEAFFSHINDTIIAGNNLNNIEAVNILVNEGKLNIEKLIDLGVNFDKHKDGTIKVTKEGGHTSERILHCDGDATGKVIIETLICQIKRRKNIQILENTLVTNLIKKNDIIAGLQAIDEYENSIDIFSNNVVLATGGIGSVYKHSTNYDISCGDGISLAHSIGAKIENMEFIQFHPTTLYEVDKTFRMQLISEAVRGEGAYLLNIDHERFMSKYDERMELAPRDIVSRSIYKEMYDTWSDFVYLDCRHINFKDRFPNIYTALIKKNINPEKDLIKVIPSEHYCIGGISTKFNGQTNIKGLYAVGECASTGVHGSNRLASNSLLECVVFSKRISEQINSLKFNDISPFNIKTNIARRNFNYKNIRIEIADLMERYCGIVRKREGLRVALAIVEKHLLNLKRYPNNTKKYFETLFISNVSYLILKSSYLREKSIGCHYLLEEV